MERTDIFCYDAGDGTTRHADPFVVLRALHHYAALGKHDFNDLCRKSGDPDPAVSYEPWLALLPITAAAFGLALFDPTTGEGLTADRIDAVLDAFLAFTAQKKSQPVTSPTSPTPSA